MNQIVVGKNIPSGDELLKQLVQDSFATRLFAKDNTLWGPEAEAEAATRLGWLDAFELAPTIVREVEELRKLLQHQRLDRVVLSGMGGSSLAPEAIARRDSVPLTVLDSTHPTQVKEALTELDRTVLVVSSKSGSTVETRSHLATFEVAYRDAGINPAERIIVVTDPGSQLHSYATQNDYRVFLADPNVGGRYSAFTAFGLVPSVLAGADGLRLVDEAAQMLERVARDNNDNPALQLGALLAAQLPQRYTFVVTEYAGTHEPVGDWLEQLLAESTGKDGKGILPIHVHPQAPEIQAALAGEQMPRSMFAVLTAHSSTRVNLVDDAVTVHADLGGQLLIWLVATTALSRLIGVDPFNQPDVESAKVAARAALKQSQSQTEQTPIAFTSSADLYHALESAVTEDSYIVVQSFVHEKVHDCLVKLRDCLAEKFAVPVSVGIGPRYLHSTGQLHKGGPQKGVFIQVLDEEMDILPIPSQQCSFAELITSQAEGDREVLQTKLRPVIIVSAKQLDGFFADQ